MKTLNTLKNKLAANPIRVAFIFSLCVLALCLWVIISFLITTFKGTKVPSSMSGMEMAQQASQTQGNGNNGNNGNQNKAAPAENGENGIPGKNSTQALRENSDNIEINIEGQPKNINITGAPGEIKMEEHGGKIQIKIGKHPQNMAAQQESQKKPKEITLEAPPDFEFMNVKPKSPKETPKEKSKEAQKDNQPPPPEPEKEKKDTPPKPKDKEKPPKPPEKVPPPETKVAQAPEPPKQAPEPPKEEKPPQKEKTPPPKEEKIPPPKKKEEKSEKEKSEAAESVRKSIADLKKELQKAEREKQESEKSVHNSIADIQKKLQNTEAEEQKSEESVHNSIADIQKKLAKEKVANNSGAGQNPGQGQTNSLLKKYYGRMEKTYSAKIRDLIKSNWLVPDAFLDKGNDLETCISMRLDKNGSLQDIKLIKNSGETLFDNSALQAIKRVGIFPPFPPEMHEDSEEFLVPFVLKDNNQGVL
jgi:colicin import membrane protein